MFRFTQHDRWLIFALIGICLFAPASQSAEQSLGDKIKKFFAPSPTPTPHKKRKTTSTRKKSSPSSKAKSKSSPTPSASPKRHKKSSPKPTPEESATPSAKKKKHKASPTPSGTEIPSPAPSETPTPSPHETAGAEEGSRPTPTVTETPKKERAPVSIPPEQIIGYQDYPAQVKKVVGLALDLAGRGLDYKYGSADPDSGGMDCSGFVYYVLTQTGVADVPRDSAGQYAWVRKSGNFEAVISHKEDTFELNNLKAGDLLFWTGTYEIDRDPPITHAMIYLGREKNTKKRIMIGASDGRTYHGKSRYGVSVFDFKITPPEKTKEGRLTPTFVGYGHVPGLSE